MRFMEHFCQVLAGKHCHSFGLASVLALGLMAVSGFVVAETNFRVVDGFNSSTLSADYVLAISDCQLVDRVEITAGSYHNTSIAQYDSINGSCEFPFTADGAGYLNPAATIFLKTGQQQNYSEQFSVENELPEVTLESVAVRDTDGKQYLIVTANAIDNVDINYVGFSVVGVRASDLRSAGGVIEKARQKAYAVTNNTQRIYPVSDFQTSFSLSIPVDSQLDLASISHDGVVIYDIVSVDSSGNTASTSGIAFTGDDVNEEILGISVQPENISISNELEIAAIVPYINYQFQGMVASPGLGSGFTYTSSHSDYIRVTPDGLVFPLQETGDLNVIITVSFPGYSDIQVPIEVNYNKTLDHLILDGVVDNTITLESLNNWQQLPKIIGVLHNLDGSVPDDSEFDLNPRTPVLYTVSSAHSAILDAKTTGELRAKAVLDESAPAQLTVSLADNPSVKGVFNVVAKDALPGISMSVPRVISVGEILKLEASANDDVAVREVRFFLDDVLLAIKSQSPYELYIPIEEALLNKSLAVRAEVFDSAGQANFTETSQISVVDKIQETLPELVWEKPGDLQRVVEGEKILLQLSRKIEDILSYKKYLSYVDFYLDGSKIGQTISPIIETRQEGDKKVEYELWKFFAIMPQISVDETSRVIYAVMRGRKGSEVQLDSRSVRVIKNQSPTIRISSPVEGAKVTAGETLDFSVQFTDDAFAGGIDLEFYVNEELVKSLHHANPKLEYVDAIDVTTDNYVYSYPVDAELIGVELKLHALAID